MTTKIEYVAEIKTWFDRVNGNSYFSARIYDLKNDLVAVVPFQYGYGTHPDFVAIKAIQNYEGIHEVSNSTFQRTKIITHDYGLKRDCVRWGEAPEYFTGEVHIGSSSTVIVGAVQ